MAKIILNNKKQNLIGRRKHPTRMKIQQAYNNYFENGEKRKEAMKQY